VSKVNSNVLLIAGILFSILGLAPFNFALCGLIFFVPILSLLKYSSQKNDLVYGGIYGLILCTYIYWGLFSYSPILFFAAIIGFSITASFLFKFVGYIIRQERKFDFLLIGVLWVFFEIVLEKLSLPFSAAILFTDFPEYIQILRFGGQYLFVWLLITFQVCLYKLIMSYPRKLKAYSELLTLTIILLLIILPRYAPKPKIVSTLNAAVVQTNTHPFNYINISADGVLKSAIEKRLSLSKQLNSTMPTINLAIWPESSALGYEFRNSNPFLHPSNILHIINSPDLTPAGIKHNSVFSVTGKGDILYRSGKKRLIPFLEHSFAPTLNSGVHTVVPEKPGVLVCFESGFTKPAIDLVNDKAGLLAISTSDAYAGPSVLSLLHAKLAILRAVENQRFVLRSANGGISMVISNEGKILDQLPMFIDGILTHTVDIITHKTFYTKFYLLWHYGFLFLGILIILSILLKSNSHRDNNIKGSSLFSIKNLILYTFLFLKVILFQMLFMSQVFQSSEESNQNISLYSLTYSNTFKSNAFKFNNLHTTDHQTSLWSALVYILNTYGNNITVDKLQFDFNKLQETTFNHVDVNDLIESYGYLLVYNQNPDPHNLPMIFKTKFNEYVVLEKLSNHTAFVFSPINGKIELDRKYFFNNLASQAPIYLSTTPKDWD